MAVHPHDPLHAKLASVKRDKTTGTFHRHEVESDWLKEFPKLKSEFDRVDALSEPDMLREYGFALENKQGELVRVKRGTVRDKYTPVEGGYEHYTTEQDVDDEGNFHNRWKKVMHHLDLFILNDTTGAWEHVPSGYDVAGLTTKTEPNYLWPTERLRLSYGHALKQRAYQVAKAEAG